MVLGGVTDPIPKLEMKYRKVLKKVILKVLMKSKVLKSSIFQGIWDRAGTRSRGDPPRPSPRQVGPEKMLDF